MAAGEGQGGYAYIGSFTTAGGAGITEAAVDPDTGALTVLATTDAVADPSYLALSAEGGLLYAVSESEEGAVAAFRTGGLEAAGRPVPVHGSGPTHLTRYAGHLLTANYVSGSVSAVPLTAEGTPGPEVSGVLRYEGSGPHPQRQQGRTPTRWWPPRRALGARRRPRHRLRPRLHARRGRCAAAAPGDRAAPRLGPAPPGLPPGRGDRLRGQRTHPEPHRLPLGRRRGPPAAARRGRPAAARARRGRAGLRGGGRAGRTVPVGVHPGRGRDLALQRLGRRRAPLAGRHRPLRRPLAPRTGPLALRPPPLHRQRTLGQRRLVHRRPGQRSTAAQRVPRHSRAVLRDLRLSWAELG
ncbi:hypothetical protein DUI70_6664 [Streptomyces albus]|nr:hypothetical protein DUI70_6664 [Streptomyces albus]